VSAPQRIARGIGEDQIIHRGAVADAEQRLAQAVAEAGPDGMPTVISTSANGGPRKPSSPCDHPGGGGETLPPLVRTLRHSISRGATRPLGPT
jgi:hypothetical protein